MKKIILSAALLATTLMGCSDYLDINHNPNYPGSVSNDLLLPSAEAYIAGRVGGNMFNYAGFFCQYFEQAPDASQYQDISEYRFTIDMFSILLASVAKEKTDKLIGFTQSSYPALFLALR